MCRVEFLLQFLDAFGTPVILFAVLINELVELGAFFDSQGLDSLAGFYTSLAHLCLAVCEFLIKLIHEAVLAVCCTRVRARVAWVRLVVPRRRLLR